MLSSVFNQPERAFRLIWTAVIFKPGLLILFVAAGAVFDVRQYGAAGDGRTKETPAIRKAIDACAKAGGGQVYFP